MSVLDSLRLPVFRRVWAGQLVNMVGDAMFAVAIALFLADRPDRARAIGVVLACIAVGGVVSLLIGSGLIDRFRRTRVIIVSDLIRAAAVLVILTVGVDAPLAVLAGLSLCVGIGGGIYRPAYGALIPALVPADRVRSANALRSMSNRLAVIVGSAVGGVAVAAAGAECALALNIATFVVSVLTLLGIEDYAPSRGDHESTFLEEAIGGARYVCAHRWQLAVLLQGTIQIALVIGPLSVLMPMLYADRWDGRLVGLIVAAEALGAFLGAAWGGTIRTVRPGTWGMLALSAQLPQIVAVALLAPAWGIVPASVLAGIGLSLFGVLWISALQSGTPPDLLGRVLSIDALANSALSPVGLLLAAAAIPLIGPQPVAWVAAGVLLVSIAAVLPVRGVAELADRTGVTPGRHNPAMQLRIDAERDVKSHECGCCGVPFDRVTGFINTENGAFAIYYASCYHHDGTHEAYIDVILDNAWDSDRPCEPSADRVTFGCRVGPIEGQENIACSLVGGASVAPEIPLYGRKLDPDQARQHPWVSLYWDTVDHILEHDPTVKRHLYGAG